jgi:hypothetical protein
MSTVWTLPEPLFRVNPYGDQNRNRSTLMRPYEGNGAFDYAYDFACRQIIRFRHGTENPMYVPGRLR